MDEEYCKLLEEYVEHLSMALIVDMMKRGVFKDSATEIKLEKKFVDEVKKEYANLDVEDEEERAVAAVLNALSNYYGSDMYEEEMLARANIILNFIGDELEK
ncbi:hypothetical protein AciM339_0675 [Aciduliprofundum sp. MAR08-339]|uniref:hypothetical protein n=1 Tax=Aciduliprofundum sp. (strain MAR08-339) TaxID=673860 RepID=UPI0002A47A98|nr:hypothetical protein AciM339_0675 [Aciduliprofundum sp. MAR08-339]